MTEEQGLLTIKKVIWRLMPILIVAYTLCYLERINIGFAALTMNAEIGLTPYTFGLGAGLFFWGYFLFEIPSNLLLEKFGARRWIFRIMITWGFLSMSFALVQGQTSFLVLRFLFGLAEAGFFPGIILYMTYWIPAVYRARFIAWFMISVPLSLAIGSPISTALLAMDGIWGLSGWRWMFIFEGLPSVLMSFVILYYLPDRPKDAKWLTVEEKEWLTDTIGKEAGKVAAKHGMSVWQVFKDWRVFALSFVYFAATAISLGLAFFLPQIVKSQGYSLTMTGWVTSIPFVFGALGMLVIGWISDRLNERRITLFMTLMAATVGFAGAGWLGSTNVMSVGMITIAAIGLYGVKAPFWPLPSMILAGPAAAAGIALISSVGNLGGFAGPVVLGIAKESSNSFSTGLYCLALIALSGAIVTLLTVRPGWDVSKAKIQPQET